MSFSKQKHKSYLSKNTEQASPSTKHKNLNLSKQDKKHNDTLFLFDVDGTLTEPRSKAPDSIVQMISKLKNKVNLGIVGGSDIGKIIEQVGKDTLAHFKYVFAENGAQFYQENKLVKNESLVEFLGNINYTKLINKILIALSNAECPVKRGLFIESRGSSLNISPVGRLCSLEEREEFVKWDRIHGVRNKIINDIMPCCKEMGLTCSIGGEISFGIYPVGWDKTFCLQYIRESKIVFFGDKVYEGGLDYEIYNHGRVKGVEVDGPESTLHLVFDELIKL